MLEKSADDKKHVKLPSMQIYIGHRITVCAHLRTCMFDNFQKKMSSADFCEVNLKKLF